MVIIKSNLPPLGGTGLSNQRSAPGTPVQPSPGAGAVKPAPGPGQIVPGPGGGSALIHRNFVRLSEEVQDAVAGAGPTSRLAKAVAGPVPVVYYAHNPLTDTFELVLAMRLSLRNVAFFADMVPGTTVITYSPFGVSPIIEVGGDFEIPGTEGVMISSLRFGQVKRLGDIAEP